jgi:hypothetical protein
MKNRLEPPSVWAFLFASLSFLDIGLHVSHGHAPAMVWLDEKAFGVAA